MDRHALEERLWGFYRNVFVCVENVFEPLIASEGLTLPQFRILVEIRDCGAPSPGELCRASRMESRGFGAQCRRLERAGWIERTRGGEDGLGEEIRLSEKGKASLEKIWSAIRERHVAVLLGKSRKEIGEMEQGLDAVEKMFCGMEGLSGEE